MKATRLKHLRYLARGCLKRVAEYRRERNPALLDTLELWLKLLYEELEESP